MHKSRPKRIAFPLLSLLLIFSGLSAISVAVAPKSNAASGTLTSGSCSAAVNETTTASIVKTESNCYLVFKSGTNSFTVPSGITSVDL